MLIFLGCTASSSNEVLCWRLLEAVAVPYVQASQLSSHGHMTEKLRPVNFVPDPVQCVLSFIFDRAH